jgi:TonB family protein
VLTDQGNLISARASIIRAASKGDAGAVRTLLAEGADVDQRGRGGHTALMVAAIFNDVDIARLLLAAGADVQLQDNLGLTAREWAERRGSAEVAQLLSNDSPAEIVPSPKKPHAKHTQPKLEAASGYPEAQPKSSHQQDASTSTEEHPRTPETKIPTEPDTIRFMKFHRQIMAAQQRRQAEQARRDSEQEHRNTDDVARYSSEKGAVPTWSSTRAIRREMEEARQPSPIETKTAFQDAPSVADEQQKTIAGSERSRAEQVRPTASQLARIAATIEHLRIQEDSRERPEVESRALSDGTTRAAAERELDHNDPEATLERLAAALSTRPARLAPKTSESFNPPASKRCPKCNATYENPLLIYCAYDASKLVSANSTLFSYIAARDSSRQTLWALVAIVAVLGAFLGYLMNSYRSREKVSNAPNAALSNALGPAQGDPEMVRKDLPLVAGALSGMEVDVPEPEYPEQARAEGVSGAVTVRVQVNQKGRVILARSSGGNWRLRAAAVEAAQKATFSPEKLAVHGKVVSGTITYNFAAQTQSPAATESQSTALTNSPSPKGSSSATGSPAAGSAVSADGDHPVVGGPLVGAESNLPQPDYPEPARSQGIYGMITVTVRVNRAGKVISWRTSKGDSQLRAAALKAAKKATFSPEKLPGTGEVVGTITYNFKG